MNTPPSLCPKVKILASRSRVSDTPMMGSVSDPVLRRFSERTGRDPRAGAGSTERSDPPDPPSGEGEIPPSGTHGPAVDDGDDGLKYILDLAKTEVDFQFRVAERLDSKARGLFALAGAIFAAAQALALREDVLNRLSDGDRSHLIKVATIAGVLVGLALLSTAYAIFVRKEKSVESKTLFNWMNQLAQKNITDADVSQRAVQLYVTLMHERQEKNKGRAKVLFFVQVLCLLAIAASVWELIVALHGLA
jgi:hypothetical protein